jgi:hypothetical protein
VDQIDEHQVILVESQLGKDERGVLDLVNQIDEHEAILVESELQKN